MQNINNERMFKKGAVRRSSFLIFSNGSFEDSFTNHSGNSLAGRNPTGY